MAWGLSLCSRAWVTVPCGAIAVGLVNVAMKYEGLDRHIRVWVCRENHGKGGIMSQVAGDVACAEA